MPNDDDLQEIKKWVRIMGLESLSKILDDFDDRDLVMFDMADGETTTTEIGESVGIDRTTVSGYFSEWSELGIVEKDGQQWKHVAPLSAMGMERPEFDSD